MTDFYQSYLHAGNPLSGDQARTLAFHNHYRVRMRVAENPQVTPEILSQLGQDAHVEVRQAVATNPSTPQEVIFNLTLDSDPTVRYAMAENYYAPQAVLQVLIDDENPYVSCRAVRTLNKLLLCNLNQCTQRAQALSHLDLRPDERFHQVNITSVC